MAFDNDVLFERFCGEHDDDGTSPSLASYNAGVRAHAAGDLDGALAHFVRAVDLDGKKVHARNNLALCLAAKGRFVEALDHLEIASTLGVDPEVTVVNLAAVLDASGRESEGLEILEANADKPWVDLNFIYFRARLLDHVGRHEEAVKVMRDAADSAPDDLAVWDNFGIFLHHAGKYEDAVHAFTRAAQLDPDHPLPYYNLSTSLSELERHEEAANALRRHIELDPSHSIAVWELGKALSLLDRHEESLEQFERYLALAPEDPVAMRSVAVEQYLIGRYAEAEAGLRVALARDPNDLGATLGLCEAIERLGRFEELVTFTRESVARFPNNVDLRLGQIRAITHHLGPVAAVRELEKSPHPADADSWHELCAHLMSEDLSEELVTVGERFAARYENDPRAHNLLAWGYELTDREDDAAASMRRAHDLAPDALEHRIELGHMLASIGETGEAIALLEGAIDEEPSSLARLELARALAADGQFDRATEQLDLLSGDDPDDAAFVRELRDWIEAQRNDESAEDDSDEEPTET